MMQLFKAYFTQVYFVLPGSAPLKHGLRAASAIRFSMAHEQ